VLHHHHQASQSLSILVRHCHFLPRPLYMYVQYICSFISSLCFTLPWLINFLYIHKLVKHGYKHVIISVACVGDTRIVVSVFHSIQLKYIFLHMNKRYIFFLVFHSCFLISVNGMKGWMIPKFILLLLYVNNSTTTSNYGKINQFIITRNALTKRLDYSLYIHNIPQIWILICLPQKASKIITSKLIETCNHSLSHCFFPSKFDIMVHYKLSSSRWNEIWSFKFSFLYLL
jgi:hypothetical protein